MKRNLFVLVFSLMLLSFGLSNAQDYGVLNFAATASPMYPGTPDTLSAGVPFNIAISISITGGDTKRITWSSPFGVTGTVASVTWNDTATYSTTPMNTASGWFDSFRRTWSENWVNGPLSSTEMIFNQTGIGQNNGIPIGLPSTVICNLSGVLTLPSDDAKGSICVGRGHPSNPTYDWLFDDEPDFPAVCFPVAKAPNFAPDFTRPESVCPVQKTGQWSAMMSATFVAGDEEGNPVTYSKAGGVGTVLAGGGWTYQPTCQDVGQSLNVDVFAADAMHGTLPGVPTQHCVMTVVVENTDPEIAGDCGKTYTVGIGGGSAVFNATDDNSGDTEDWSFLPDDGRVAGTFDGTNYTLVFTPALVDLGNDYTYTVKVTDCAGGFATCEVTWHTVSSLPYVIKIQKVEDQLQGHHSYVTVTKEAGSEDMLGFDFLMAYDASVLTFMGADAGVLFDIPGVYEWEYFTYRFGPNGNCGNACPSGMLRVVALAETNNGAHNPKKVSVPDGTILFTLDFLVSNNRLYECQYAPIRFYWTDCTDNTIAYHLATGPENEVITGISRDIYEFWDGINPAVLDPLKSIADPLFGFPGYLGATLACDTRDTCFWNPVIQMQVCKPGTVPWIDFINGGIDIVCADEIDDRGDVNLNKIANEIGDAVVFTNYFIKGLAAFTVNVEGQIAATDINADGITLSVADLVYLIRVIIGDALPYDKLSPYATTANFSTTGSVVNADVTLGAALFTFNGITNVSLADGATNMELKTGVVNGNTVALVLSYDKGQTCTGNILNTTGTIKSIEAVDYYGNAYKVSLPTAFTVNNYPNPFNPVAHIAFTLPSVSDWTVTIYNVAGQKVAGFSGHSNGDNLTWDASTVSSGIYFYKVEAGKNSVTKKMVLMK